MAKRFVEQGYDYITLDVNGHGQSEGLHGYIESVESVLDVCKKFAISAKGMYPAGTKFHALGMSMGGAITITLAINNPDMFSSILLAVPFLRTKEPVSGICMLKCLGCMCPRWAFLSVEEEKPALVPLMADERYYKGKGRLRTMGVLLDLGSEVDKRKAELKTDFHVAYCGKDDLVSNKAIEELLATSVAQRKEKIFFEEIDHSIFMYKEKLDALVASQVQFLKNSSD